MGASSRKLLIFLGVTLIAVAAVAQDIPLQNWEPAPWSRPPAGKIASTAYSAAFMPLPPCRVYDSRSATMLPGATSRTINIDGGPCAGIPAAAEAYSINLTAFGSTPSTSYAFMTAYPTGTTRPTASTLNFMPGTQVANAAVVPAGTGGDINIYTSYTTHFLIDINGYYTSSHNAGDGFLSISGTGTAVTGLSTDGWGIWGHSATNHAVVGTSNGTSDDAGVVGASTNGRGVYGTSTNFNGVWAESTNWDGLFADGGRHGAWMVGDAIGAVGVSRATTGYLAGVAGVSSSTSPGAAGVKGVGVAEPHSAFLSHLTPGGIGLLGLNTSNYGIVGVSNYIGVKLINEDTSGVRRSTVYLAEEGDAARFLGNVWVESFGGMPGNLNVTGTLTKGGGSFKIDHPLDPENKYLYHSFVESPDMMNIYNGVVELDAFGEAIVQLPQYFEALNKDFRYQLTAMGRPQPDLYIADEIANNIFRIAGGHPHAKVSWTVTGVRHDKFADAHRIEVEVDKEDGAKGYYLHPAEWAKSPELKLKSRVRRTDAPDRQAQNDD